MSKMYRVDDRPIPGYRLIAFLGEGGFGEVWKASNESNIEVALKIINLQGKQSVREVFAIRKLRNIRHPNLIPILGFWLKDEAGNIIQNAAADSLSGFKMEGNYQFFVSMGLGDKTLMDRLKECQQEGREGIPLDELLEYMDEAARALDFLNTARHDMGGEEKVSIEHCDIKPQNVLLVGGSVQICDFGLARIQQQGVKQNQTMSFSHNYVAPEMLKREIGPGRTTDQYSLAISYVQLRTGKLPFHDVSFAPAVLTAHLEGKLDYSMMLPSEQKIVRKATSLRPEDRFPTARAFVDALREMAVTQSRPVKAPTGIKGPLRTGTEIVPGYKLEELIGRGSFGEVWRATAPGRLKKAIKIIRNLELASSKQELRSLDLITEVRHPYLIQIEACYLLDKQGDLIPDEAREMKDGPKAETLVIVSELADSHLGKRLEDSIRQQGYGLPPKELLSYMRHVAIALDKLNFEHDIIHRDVKPENILLVGGIAKLADFGLAKALEGSSAVIHTKSIGMTPAYAAPELCNGRIEQSTDQYSLALTYYHLRSGKLATGDVGDLSELIRAHLSNKLDFSSATPLEAEVLRRGAALNSQDRYPNCVTFIQALMACFSQRELPRDTKINSAESMEEMPSLRSMSALDWKQPGPAQASPLMMDVKAATKPTDTVDKLTDTARETVAKSQRSSRKEPPATTSTRQPIRRRRSHVARLIVSLLILAVVGGIIAGAVIIARLPKPTASSFASNAVSSASTVISSSPVTPTKSTEVVETKSIPKEAKASTPEPAKTKEPEPARLTAKDVLNQARKVLPTDARLAASELLELIGRYQTAEASFEPESLQLAAECYSRLPETEPKRQELKGAYSSYANQYFKDRSAMLRSDSKDIDWTTGTKLSVLASNETWVAVYRMEKVLHQDAKPDTLELERLASLLTPGSFTELGAYGHYLRGALATRLKNIPAAVDAFLKLDKDPNSFHWSPERETLILATVKPSLAEYRKKAFAENRWREPLASADDANRYVAVSKKLEAWNAVSPSAEDTLLRLLTESHRCTSVDQAKEFLKRWPAEPAAATTIPAWLQLATTQQQFLLLKLAGESPETILPVVFRLYTALKSQPQLAPSIQEMLSLFDNWLPQISLLTRRTSLGFTASQQLAQIYAGRAKLVIENHYTPWLRKSKRLTEANDDLETALKLTEQSITAERRGNMVWQAFARRELKQPGWHTKIANLSPSNVPGSALPLLHLLQGIHTLEQARLSQNRNERLSLVKSAAERFERSIEETRQTSPHPYWLNLLRLAASQAYLEYANYIDISEGPPVLQECEKRLQKALQFASDADSDKQADMLKPEAQMALGNAKEDFGLLLDKPRHAEAIEHFTNAIQAWRGEPQLARALINRARAMIRANSSQYDQQIDNDLRDALELKPDDDIASELHLLLANRQRRARNYDQAKSSLKKAINFAKTPSFKDDARCALLELILATPYDASVTQVLKDRTKELIELAPSLARVDPQIEKHAELLLLDTWNEIDNLCYLLMKKPGERAVYEKLFDEYLNKLKASKTLLGRWHAAKQQGKKFIMLNQIEDAWNTLNFQGSYIDELKSYESLPDNQALRLKASFFLLTTTRFELLVSRPRTKALTDHLQENIPVVERVQKLVKPDDPYAGVISGFAGYIRRNILLVYADSLSDEDKSRYKQEAIRYLLDASRLAPKDPLAWQWMLALIELENDVAKKVKYLAKLKELVNEMPDSVMNKKSKEELLKVAEEMIPK